MCAEEEKGDALIRLSRTLSPATGSLVFVHPHARVSNFEAWLRQKNVNAYSLHQHTHSFDATQRATFMSRLATGHVDMMLATTATARGLDFPGLRAVTLLYPPATPGEYLHISGRVGRMGSSGTCLTLVTPGEELEHYLSLMASVNVPFTNLTL